MLKFSAVGNRWAWAHSCKTLQLSQSWVRVSSYNYRTIHPKQSIQNNPSKRISSYNHKSIHPKLFVNWITNQCGRALLFLFVQRAVHLTNGCHMTWPPGQCPGLLGICNRHWASIGAVDRRTSCWRAFLCPWTPVNSGVCPQEGMF